MFEIAIQTGAIFAVILVYAQKSVRPWWFAQPAPGAVVCAECADSFIPAVVLGLLLGSAIKRLFNANVVAATFIVGGLVILLGGTAPAAHRACADGGGYDLGRRACCRSGAVLAWCQAPAVANCHHHWWACCWAFHAPSSRVFVLPGWRRHRSGGLQPFKERALLSAADIPLFTVGLTFSFVSASLCIRWLRRHRHAQLCALCLNCRISFGLVVLLTSWAGWVRWAGKPLTSL